MAPRPHTFSRRALLRGAAGLGALAALPPLLAACGDDDGEAGASPTAGSGAGDGEPRRGGVVRVAALGSPADRLDPGNTLGLADYVVLFNLYDSLAVVKGDRIELQLAESLEPNADATSWTVRLVEGAAFHDGRPVRAADVASSLAHLAASPTYGSMYADVDLGAARAVDDRTLELPLVRPRADLVEAVVSQISLVFPQGTTDFAAGIGSGPFRLERYEPGRGAVLVRNDDYWAGPALLDGLETVPIADAGARLSALRSGEVEYAVGITAASAAAEGDDGAVEIRRGGTAHSQALTFQMNVTTPPFDDPDVRRAIKLAIDRQALVDTVLLGAGTIGNDLLGLGLPGYASDIPQRERDVDEARRLLEGKGADRLTLVAADLVPGLVDAASLFAEQLGDVGIDVTVEERPADSYFDDFAAVLGTPFQAMYYINRPVASTLAAYTGSAATFNLTGYATAEHDALLTEAQATIDPAERDALIAKVQQALHDEGGDIVWGYQEQLDATVPGLADVELSQSIPILARAHLPG